MDLSGLSDWKLIVLVVVAAVFLLGLLATWRGNGWDVSTKWLKMKVGGRGASPPVQSRMPHAAAGEHPPSRTGDAAAPGGISNLEILGGGARITNANVPINVGHTIHAPSPREQAPTPPRADGSAGNEQ